MFLMFGTQVQDENNSRLVPILDTIFSPDISVLNQKIVRGIYPNATMNFLADALANNNISELKIYPSSYINNNSASTLIDPLLQFLVDSNVASNIKYKPNSDLFGDVINQVMQEIVEQGFKAVKKSNQFESKFINRTVKLHSDQSSTILVGQLSLKLFISPKMYVSLFPDPDDPDETLLDQIMQKMVFFKTTDLSKLTLAYRLKIGLLDVESQEFQTLMTFKPIELPLNLGKRQDTRILQVSIQQFLVNIVDQGISQVSDKISKQILINRKQVKIKI